MGLFQHKKQSQKTLSDDEIVEFEQHFFDENFREELRNHARLFFEQVIKENGTLFKQDLDEAIKQINTELKDHTISQLDATINEVNAYLKEHVTQQLDAQFLEYGNTIKEAQDSVLQSLNQSVTKLEEQHQELSVTLKKNIEEQEKLLTDVSKENLDRLNSMKEAQDSALESLNHSVEALKGQYERLSVTLQKNVEEQENVMIGAFQENMAQIIEHYLLGALGDQYDMKAQLPSIIKQMDENKQAIVDDMKL